MKKLLVLFILFVMIFLIACSSEDDYESDIRAEEDNRVTQTETKDDKKNDAEVNNGNENSGNDNSSDNDLPSLAPIKGTWFEINDGSLDRILEVSDDGTFEVYAGKDFEFRGTITVKKTNDKDHPYIYSFINEKGKTWGEFDWNEPDANGRMTEMHADSLDTYFVRDYASYLADNDDDDYWDEDDDDDSEDDNWDDGNGDDDNGYVDDNGDNGPDDEDEPKATYGTYSYLPDGMLPYFDEITIEDLYPDNDSYNKMLKDLQKEYEAYKTENSYSEFGELDLNSIGTTSESYWGIYYQNNDESYYTYDDEPLEGVENWLVFFKCGTWAIYDNGFKNVIDAGVLASPDSSDWQFFTLNRKGELIHIMEFDTGTMSGDLGAYTRVYELWDYENGNGGSGNNDRANDDTDNGGSSSGTTSTTATLLDGSGKAVAEVKIPEGYSVDGGNTSADELNITTDTGGFVNIRFTSWMSNEELLNEGQKIKIGTKTAYTNSDGKELEEDKVSHTLIILGYDSTHDNRMIYSYIEYGDVPRTYRLMYIQLGENAWASVYSPSFQQDGIDNLDAIDEQLKIYLDMFL